MDNSSNINISAGRPSWGKYHILLPRTDNFTGCRMYQMKICKIEGCRNRSHSKGLCPSHYARQRRYGDPLKGGRYKETHGMSRTLEYKTWCNILARCDNPKDKRYKNYGARGIEVCDRWKYSFNNFHNDMGDKPFIGAEIDRIDNNGNYEPSNCKWSTRSENCRHTRGTVLNMELVRELREKHISHTVKELSKIYNININTLYSAIAGTTWKE